MGLFSRKHEEKVLWGFEGYESDCHCDYDNNVHRVEYLYLSKDKRDSALKKWINKNSDRCVKVYRTLCYRGNTKKKSYDE